MHKDKGCKFQMVCESLRTLSWDKIDEEMFCPLPGLSI